MPEPIDKVSDFKVQSPNLKPRYVVKIQQQGSEFNRSETLVKQKATEDIILRNRVLCELDRHSVIDLLASLHKSGH